MTPVLPCSTSNGLLFPGATIVSRNSNQLSKYNLLGKSSRQALVSHRFLLPLSLSGRLYPNYLSARSLRYRSTVHILAATGTDTAVEEPGSAIAGEEAGTSELLSTSEEPSTPEAVVTPASQSKQIRPPRKSTSPTVKNEELVPGATFTGKVRSIQPFGAFVDFGAFSNGLVHVSQLSNSYVKDVGSVVSVGQEVKVRIIEANISTGRISLSMREADDSRNMQQQNDDADSTSNDMPKPSRRNPRNANQKTQVTSKFVQGQELQGTVKNLTRAGAFISLPEGEEGFLPTSEQLNGEFRMRGSSLQTGQEVSVRVLRISRGQATLTMKKEVSMEDLESKLTSGEIVGSNAFVRAFRNNKDIATFLDEREKLQKSIEASVSPKTSEVQDEVTIPSSVEASTASVDAPPTEPSSIEENLEGTNNTTQEEMSSDMLTPEGSVEEAPVTSGINGNGDESSPPPVDGVEDDQTSMTDVDKEVVASEAMVADTLVTEPSSIEETKEVSSEILTPEGTVEQASGTNVVNENSNESDPAKDVESEQILPSATTEKEMTSPVLENSGSVSTSGQEGNEPAPQESTITAAISPALVKQLREETGAGMMDCKKALSETGGDIVKAQEFLRKKGLASADKKASRATAEGRIGSYIHDSRIGILVEVNCETDFVSRGEIFKELVDDLAMQAAACPQVQYLVTDDVPEDIVSKEREIEMQKEDLLSKPEQIRSKIVEGRINKRLQELALLEQPYIKNDKVLVKDWVKQTIATIGENIKVNRFVRYNLGEGLERKSQDFAAEVAAQTASKPSPAAPTSVQPAVVEVQEAVEKQPTVAVSAALVKQLREETGAGMMDCKKALAETGADLEKAQEYLRKKGLSTADKKSSRLAAEGRIGSYIHDSRIGVLIEVNCETDFVGRSEKFKELVDDLAMQVVACPQVQVVSTEDIPESIRIKEKELEMQREDLQSKPENIREKIVEGRLSKRFGELALLEQPFIKNDTLLVKDLVKQTVAALGENIKVRRFVRFTLGENIEKDVKAETEA